MHIPIYIYLYIYTLNPLLITGFRRWSGVVACVRRGRPLPSAGVGGRGDAPGFPQVGSQSPRRLGSGRAARSGIYIFIYLFMYIYIYIYVYMYI